jgi:plastocyanin
MTAMMARPWQYGVIVATRTLAAVSVAAISVAGCSGRAPAPSGPASARPGSAAGTSSGTLQRVTIEGTNSLRFAPMTVHVHTGTVRITLKDTGAYPHDIVIPGLKTASPTVTGDPGGTTARFAVKFAHAGRYPFHCRYHQSAGMTGVFVVS